MKYNLNWKNLKDQELRIKVSFTSDDRVILPKGFNSILQGFVYKYIIDKNQQWLHDKGYVHENGQRFKLFVFSSILEKGKYNKKDNLFYFPNKISFLISSPVEWILENFASNIIRENKFFLYKNIMRIHSIEVFKEIYVSKNEVIIKMITPVEVHTTIDRVVNIYEKNYNEKEYKQKMIKKSKITKYFSPFDEEFSTRVCENLRKKWEVFKKQQCNLEIKIEPIFSMDDLKKNKKFYKKVIYFNKGKESIIINGWMGKYKLIGDPELIKFSYNVGLGSRNSQGFGMWDFA